ncbi:MAG: hypothetical protein KIH63_002140 [Candidatus Saccharibacteria bacterium]|nr:hypothetical protein [Candidatus Saccharibacteria bacterium]
MTDAPNPYDNRGKRDFILPEHLGEGVTPRTDGYLPELDASLLADRAPQGWDRITGNPFAGVTAEVSDAVVLSGADRDRIVRDVMYSDSALTTAQIANTKGLTAQDILEAERNRLLRGIGQDPDTSHSLEGPTAGIAGDNYWEGISNLADRVMGEQASATEPEFPKRSPKDPMGPDIDTPHF